MDWLTFISTMFKTAVWPGVAFYLLFLVRGKISTLLEGLSSRLERAEVPGVKLEFAKLEGIRKGIEISLIEAASKIEAKADEAEQVDEAKVGVDASTSGDAAAPVRNYMYAKRIERMVRESKPAPVLAATAELQRMSSGDNAGGLLFLLGDWLQDAVTGALNEVGQRYGLAAKAEGQRLHYMDALRDSKLLDDASVDVIGSLLAQRDRLHNTTVTRFVSKEDAANYMDLCQKMVARLGRAVEQWRADHADPAAEPPLQP